MNVNVFFLILSLAFISFGTPLSNITDVIVGFGYEVEDVTCVTEDGYILTLLHIPKNKAGVPATRCPVLLQHGLLDSCDSMIINGPPQALSFYLAEEGYDVWLGNNRGNGISMSHTSLSPDSDEFWDFSWEEMAKYDFPASIQCVRSHSPSNNTITYIGHSEGTTQALAGMLLHPELVDSIHLMVLVSPVATIAHLSLPLPLMMSELRNWEFFKILGRREFNMGSAIQKVAPSLCHLSPRACDLLASLWLGPDNYINESRWDYYGEYEPNPTSVKNMAHWSQLVRSGKFQSYDFGTEKANLKAYGQLHPPLYDLMHFPSLPLAMFYGTADALGDTHDTYDLFNVLTEAGLHFFDKAMENYGHGDPVLGYRAYLDVYPIIVKLIEKTKQK